MPDFFVVAKEQVSRLGGLQAGLLHGVYRSYQASYTGFIIQMARAHKTLGHFDPWIKSDDITHFDPQAAGFLRVSCAGIQAHFHGVIIPFGLVHLRPMDMRRSFFQKNCAANGGSLGGENCAAFAFNGIPGISTQLGEAQSAIRFDLFDHCSQRIGVRRQGARRSVCGAFPGCQQSPFARPA